MGEPKARLLITRFAPHAARLAEQLNAQGVFALAQPLLQVEKTAEFDDASLLISTSYDYIIAISRHAVDYSDQALASKSWPVCNYLAVGKATQKKLQAVTGQKVSVPDEFFSSEGLLELPCLKQVQGKRILILRGVGGRPLLAEQLTARGAIVEYYQPYQRATISLNGQELIQQWRQQNINGVIVSSVELLQRLIAITPQQELGWLKAITLYAPSERIADQATLAGWSNVRLLSGMLDKQIVDYFIE